ncbi:unnamed protein product, partial [Staurois parvus]
CTVSLGHSRSPINGKSRRCRLGHLISCVQSQLITWDMGTDDQCGPRSATCQCPSMPPASAHQCLNNDTYQCLPVHINATYQCPSDLPFSVTYQCQSVPPINASQCHLSVLPISVTYQCQSVPPISVHQ